MIFGVQSLYGIRDCRQRWLDWCHRSTIKGKLYQFYICLSVFFSTYFHNT